LHKVFLVGNGDGKRSSKGEKELAGLTLIEKRVELRNGPELRMERTN
jgi:hypothetical protein